MSKNRYVLFLRLNYRRKIEESECYVAMELFDLEFAVDNFDFGELTPHFGENNFVLLYLSLFHYRGSHEKIRETIQSCINFF